MKQQTDQIWTLLQQHEIVQGEQPEINAIDSPWYIKVLLAFSGWLAAIFILGFLAALFEFVFRNSTISAAVGAAMIAVAFALLHSSDNEFVEHLGLATSLAGQALITYAAFDLSDHNEAMALFLLAVLQAGLVVIMANYVHTVFSAAVSAIALTMAFYEWGIPYGISGLIMLGASFCWLSEFRYPKKIKKIRGVGYGLVLALIIIKGMALFDYHLISGTQIKPYSLLAQPWLEELIITIAALYLVWSLLQRYRQEPLNRIFITALLATLLICLVSVNAPGVAVGMIIICLGFMGTNRVLIGLGIIALLFYISSYYYLLDTTLLVKSISMLAVGLVLFIIRRVLKSLFHPSNQEAPNV